MNNINTSPHLPVLSSPSQLGKIVFFITVRLDANIFPLTQPWLSLILTEQTILISLLIQSDVEGDLIASIRKLRVRPVDCLHCSKLGAPRPDVVLIAGRDLASEVELADEGLALLARGLHLNIPESRNCP